jgi:Rrf2 family protein
MIDLAKNGHGAPVRRKDISKREKIPSAYLENILIQLRKAGLVTATRGVGGGMVLTRRPERIKINEIVECLEGSVAPTNCTADHDSCVRTKDCEAFQLWNRLYRAQKTILDSTALSDLIGKRGEEWVI